MITVENETLRVTVNEKGGSMTSLFDKRRNKELLYQPIPESWQGHDVFIFPMVARLVDGSYTIDNREYHFKNHGLIRYMEGKGSIKDNDIKVYFHSDASTLEQYPFEWEAYSLYHLEKNHLTVSYHIHNKDQKVLPFMVGGHPAFMVPGEKKEDHFEIKGNDITFPKRTKLVRIAQEETFSFNTGEEDFFEGDTLPLDKEMFRKINTYIFKGDTFDTITLNKLDGSRITMHKGNAKYLALWSSNEWGNFVAMEPWDGIPDYANPNRDFYQKPGINLLDPDKEYVFSYTLDID